MAVLYANLVVVFICSFFSRYFSISDIEDRRVKPNKLLALGACLSLSLVSGLRTNIGDTYFYRHAYELKTLTLDHVLAEKDIGFGILQMGLQRISSDAQILIFTTAILTNFLIIFALYKYTRLFEIGLYVYITSGMFLVSMNGIRQYLAAAIIFAATKYLLEGNWIRYMIVVLLASTFHQSALIMIPIYFIVRRKAWTGTTFILLLSSIFVVIGFDYFMELLFSAINDTQYGGYQSFQEGGANFLRVIVSAAPLVIAYLGREKLRELFPKSDYIVNMSLLGVVFMLIATQNWIFARVSIYFDLFSLILISWVIVLFRKKDQKLIYYCIISLYFVYFYYEHVITLNIIYRSMYLYF
ncbi:EpsG family protein [Bacillus alkalicellulosilyticus]|uniref:EpsG family protein n=1 Tax=Alkalihalobacterium alkalicellulosilyticum TaxID=1912214 RepID=UPI000997E80D|nr:EpsG family protein [Bacillus alkalicellulosilyticus]